jgi:hypothetical protein
MSRSPGPPDVGWGFTMSLFTRRLARMAPGQLEGAIAIRLTPLRTGANSQWVAVDVLTACAMVLILFGMAGFAITTPLARAEDDLDELFAEIWDAPDVAQQTGGNGSLANPTTLLELVRAAREDVRVHTPSNTWSSGSTPPAAAPTVPGTPPGPSQGLRGSTTSVMSPPAQPGAAPVGPTSAPVSQSLPTVRAPAAPAVVSGGAETGGQRAAAPRSGLSPVIGPPDAGTTPRGVREVQSTNPAAEAVTASSTPAPAAPAPETPTGPATPAATALPMISLPVEPSVTVVPTGPPAVTATPGATSTVPTTPTPTTGYVVVQTDAPAEGLLQLANMRPGSGVTRFVNVFNGGRATFASYTLSTGSVGPPTPLWTDRTGGLRLRVRRGTTVLYEGPVAITNLDLRLRLEPGTTDRLELEITLPHEVGNVAQGRSQSISITWTATAD